MAWLNAVPKPDERSRAAEARFKRPEISRRDKLKADGLPIMMPPNPAPELVGRLIEIGLTEPAGMGPAPISWSTLASYQLVTAVELQPWEARLYRYLSTQYLDQLTKSERDSCPAPWRGEVTQREREAEQSLLESILG